jgi:hypothetical protein
MSALNDVDKSPLKQIKAERKLTVLTAWCMITCMETVYMMSVGGKDLALNYAVMISYRGISIIQNW